MEIILEKSATTPPPKKIDHHLELANHGLKTDAVQQNIFSNKILKSSVEQDNAASVDTKCQISRTYIERYPILYMRTDGERHPNYGFIFFMYGMLQDEA